MAAYKCKIMTENGVILDRTLEAASVDEIRSRLKNQKEQLISAKKQGMNLDLGMLFSKFSKVSPKELKLFIRQLKVMLTTGIPILECMDALKKQAGSEKMRSVIGEIKTSINQGETLSGAMAHHPSVFSNLFVSMIRAGEAAGALGQILDQMESFYEMDIKTKKNVKKAIRYPIMVFSILIIAMSYASVSIVPQFASVLTNQDMELPLPTKLILGMSSLLLDYGLITLIVIVCTVGILVFLLRTPAGAYLWDQTKIMLPGIGTIVKISVMARFSLLMKTLVGNGVHITDALEVAKDTVDNRVYAKIIAEGKEKIIAGETIHGALANKHMPDIALNMISIGESSGTLTEMLECISDYFTGELDEKLENLSSMIEPIVTLVIGGFVALFVASIFAPIFKIYGSL